MIVHSLEILDCQLLALLIHIHLEAFSEASVINLIDVLLFLPANLRGLYVILVISVDAHSYFTGIAL